MVQLSATRCSCIAILWVSLMSFTAIAFYVASQWVFVLSLSTQSGNFLIHPCTLLPSTRRSSEWPLFRFSDQNIRISQLSHVFYMSSQSHPPCFGLLYFVMVILLNNMKWCFVSAVGWAMGVRCRAVAVTCPFATTLPRRIVHPS
jgi:hypothetical protein